MRALAAIIAAPALAVGLLWPALLPGALLVTFVVAVALGAILGAQRPPQPVVTVNRLPTAYEQHRWGFGVGFALGFHGGFPFVYVRRRFRR